MSEHLNDGLRRSHDLFRRDHDKLREQLMASLPEQGPAPVSIGRVQRGWRWLGETKMGRRVLGSTAVAASLVLIAFLWVPGGGGGEVYGMSDVVNLLLSSDVIHAKGYMYQPLFVPPGQERTRCPVDTWIDRPTGRQRRTSYMLGMIDNEPKLVFTESVSDGEFVMDVNHTDKTVEYTRLNPFRRTLEAHISFDQMLEQWFGNREQMGFINTGRVKLGAEEFDLWRGEMSVESGVTGMKMRIEQWVAPDSKQIGAIKYWIQAPQSTEWTLVLDIPTIERNVPIPPGSFDTNPPRDYALKNTKETAIVPELNLGGGLGLDGVWFSKHVEFALDGGSILVGWSSFDEQADQPQDHLFSRLKFGGALPKLPFEMYAMKPRQPDTDVMLTGVHLTHTRKNNRFYEWSLYVPDRPTTDQRLSGYKVLHRINSPERKVSATGQSFVTAAVRIRNKKEFDALVLGAMAELSDGGRAPGDVTYEQVMELTRQKSADATEASSSDADTNREK